MAALAERSGRRADLVLELDAQALEPVDGIQRVVREEVHELGVVGVVAALHGDLVEGGDGVLDALGLLALGIDGVQRALGDVGGAAGNAALLQHDDARAGLHGRHGRRQARAAAAHDAHVGVVDLFHRRFLGHGRLREHLEGLSLLRAVLKTGLQGDRGQRRAGDGIDVDGLVVDGLLLQSLQSIGADAERLLVGRRVDSRDGVIGEGHGHGVGGVVARHLGRVGARLPRRGIGQLLGAAVGRAAGQAEAGQTAPDAEHGRPFAERTTGDAIQGNRIGCAGHDEPPFNASRKGNRESLEGSACRTIGPPKWLERLPDSWTLARQTVVTASQQALVGFARERCKTSETLSAIRHIGHRFV